MQAIRARAATRAVVKPQASMMQKIAKASGLHAMEHSRRHVYRSSLVGVHLSHPASVDSFARREDDDRKPDPHLRPNLASSLCAGRWRRCFLPRPDPGCQRR